MFSGPHVQGNYCRSYSSFHLSISSGSAGVRVQAAQTPLCPVHRHNVGHVSQPTALLYSSACHVWHMALQPLNMMVFICHSCQWLESISGAINPSWVEIPAKPSGSGEKFTLCWYFAIEKETSLLLITDDSGSAQALPVPSAGCFSGLSLWTVSFAVKSLGGYQGKQDISLINQHHLPASRDAMDNWELNFL